MAPIRRASPYELSKSPTGAFRGAASPWNRSAKLLAIRDPGFCRIGIDMPRLKPTEEDALQEFLLPFILQGE
jgi:hypothetical protein